VHIATCASYIELHLSAPSKCRSPEAEAEYHRLTNTAEHRAELRDDRLRTRFAQLDSEMSRQAGRWTTPPDLLDT
jgi:hypothetical protein